MAGGTLLLVLFTGVSASEEMSRKAEHSPVRKEKVCKPFPLFLHRLL